MKINFTKKQYEDLLKLVYLGNWVVNAHKVNIEPDNFDQLEGYVFSFAKDFGLDNYADTDDPTMVYPTGQFEDETAVQDIISEYDDATFWEELGDQLGERDFYEKYSESEIQKMDFNERIIKLYDHMEKWSEEFEKHGVARLRAVGMTMKTEAESDKNRGKNDK
jgi:hypothetical protein